MKRNSKRLNKKYCIIKPQILILVFDIYVALYRYIYVKKFFKNNNFWLRYANISKKSVSH